MIFHRFILLLPFWSLCTVALGRNVLIGELSTNQQSFHDRNEYVYHFTADSSLTPAELQSLLDQGKFTLLPRLGANFKKTLQIHYLAVTVENNTAESQTVYCLLKNAALNKINYSILQDTGIYASTHFGDHYPFDARPNHFFLFGIPISVAPHTTSTCFIEIDKRNENLFLAFNLYTGRQYDDFKTRTYGIFGVMFGILLALVVFNLISYFTLKESIHLWYIPYALSNLYVILAFEGVDFQILYPESPFFSNISRYVATAIQLSMATLLMRKFLSISVLSTQDKIQRILTFLLWFNLISIPLTAVVYHPYFELNTHRALYLSIFSALNMLNMILIIVVCIQRFRAGMKHAMFFIAAIGFVFLGGLEYSLNVNSIIMNNILFPALIPNSLDYGIMIETLVVSIGLVYRFHEIKRDRDRMAADIKVKVAELQLASVQYRADERKRISHFIHDQIGSRLFGIRMHMHALSAKKEVAHYSEIATSTKELDIVSLKTREIIEVLSEEERIPLGECITMLLNTIQEFESTSPFPITATDISAEAAIAVSQKFNNNCELMLREILHNTRKYALPAAQEIRINSSNTRFEIIISEINSPKNPLPFKEGAGISAIRSRVHDLHGEISFSFNRGLITRISLPLTTQ
ncbi:MAG: 7TM diverse intracellular signaling domain-containing protein [Flavobacteriales bacterium]